MKQQIEQLVSHAIIELKQQGTLDEALAVNISVTSTRDRQHGDYSCNLAMVLAKKVGMNPRELAKQIIQAIEPSNGVDKIEIAGPGFINFYLSDDSKQDVIAEILEKKYDYGRGDKSQGQSILLEFISANPTGPLHVGHGRSAAFGATLADILEAAGHRVHREYYVNDAGRQMNILAVSVYLRYLECHGVSCDFPANGYKGEYVKVIAERLTQQDGQQFVVSIDELLHDLPDDEAAGGDKEVYIDALIDRVRKLLGVEQYQLLHQFGLDIILDDIRDDLAQFGVRYQEWFSEQQLFADGAIEKGIDALKASNLTYTKEGALWFKATEFGDEKDRVLIRENGQPTYFASDVAYHWNKYDRGFDRVIDIFGADHHGYMSRLRAAVTALGHDNEAFDIFLVQFAILYSGKERLSMSTRAGSFVTLRQLREDVGNDAARFFYVMRKSEQHMDFDLDLAKSQSNDNPVYYIQYAYARICSVFRQMQEKSMPWDRTMGLSQLDGLNTEHESKLLAALANYPEVIKRAAKSGEPHLLAYYLRELANDFHTYYNAHQFLVDDAALRNARLCLIEAVRQVLENGLHLIGVSTPEQM